MPAVYPTRSQRLEKLVTKLTRAYRIRRANARSTDHLVIRNRRLTQAYCEAMEAERGA